MEPVNMQCCGQLNVEIPRVSSITGEDFTEKYLRKGEPVVISDVADKWASANWTLDSLTERVGDNNAFIRQQTDQEEYKVGRTYTIRESPLREYISDLRAANSRARSSYLAVQNIKKSFPELQDDLPIPGYVGKLHRGPYLWIALKGHYEFCHFDPDDGLLVMIQGHKRVHLYGCDLSTMYPNALGSKGRTIQSQVNCSNPDLEQFPLFNRATCYYCDLRQGEMLYIPAFWWHQVTSVETCISVNYFYGDAGENQYLTKIMEPPIWPTFSHWLLNIVEQNKHLESFQRVLGRLPESLEAFLLKTWHEIPSNEQLDILVKLIMEYLELDRLPQVERTSKNAPILKIRGLLWRK